MGSFFLYEHQKGNNIETRSWLLQVAKNSQVVSVGEAWQGGLVWAGVTFSVQKRLFLTGCRQNLFVALPSRICPSCHQPKPAFSSQSLEIAL